MFYTILVPSDQNSVLHGSLEIKRKLIQLVKDKGLSDKVKVLDSGNLGTLAGVNILILPDDTMYIDVKDKDLENIINEHIIKGKKVDTLAYVSDFKILEKFEKRVVLKNVGVISPDSIEDYIAEDGFKALEKVLFEMDSQKVVDEIKKSHLRGRGGAGFPTGLKWQFVLNEKADKKYVVCNADEGEPGTFKDRLILEGDPFSIIEGMLIAGYAVKANKGYIYIRGEYYLSIDRVRKAIEKAYEYGLLGKNILGSNFSFDLEVKIGAGAYVCGEETALLSSIEGDRGYPRKKPPYPAQKGLFNKPTLVNNVETLANIRHIILNGVSWYRSLGTETCPGTKVFTILGHVKHPRLVEVEMGISLRELIFNFAGGMAGKLPFKAALVGGAAGAFISKQELNIALDFDNLGKHKAVLGSGAILVLDESVDIVNLLRPILKFFKHESCGQCAPCRLGTRVLYRLINKIYYGYGSNKDIDKMLDLSKQMKEASFCPLGQSPYMPISSAIEYFKEDFLKYVKKQKVLV